MEAPGRVSSGRKSSKVRVRAKMSGVVSGLVLPRADIKSEHRTP